MVIRAWLIERSKLGKRYRRNSGGEQRGRDKELWFDREEVWSSGEVATKRQQAYRKRDHRILTRVKLSRIKTVIM